MMVHKSWSACIWKFAIKLAWKKHSLHSDRPHPQLNENLSNCTSTLLMSNQDCSFLFSVPWLSFNFVDSALSKSNKWLYNCNAFPPALIAHKANVHVCACIYLSLYAHNSVKVCVCCNVCRSEAEYVFKEECGRGGNWCWLEAGQKCHTKVKQALHFSESPGRNRQHDLHQLCRAPAFPSPPPSWGLQWQPRTCCQGRARSYWDGILFRNGLYCCL